MIVNPLLSYWKCITFFFKDAKGQETNVEIEIAGEKVCVIQLV